MGKQLNLFDEPSITLKDLYNIATTALFLYNKNPMLCFEYLNQLKHNVLVASMDLFQLQENIQIDINEVEWKKILDEYEYEKLGLTIKIKQKENIQITPDAQGRASGVI